MGRRERSRAKAEKRVKVKKANRKDKERARREGAAREGSGGPEVRPLGGSRAGGAGTGRVTRYDGAVRVLVVGDGDLSFSRGLVRSRGGRGAGLCCTCLDSQAEVVRKYGDKAVDCVAEVARGGAAVRFRVDATRLERLGRDGERPRAGIAVDRAAVGRPQGWNRKRKAGLAGEAVAAAAAADKEGEDEDKDKKKGEDEDKDKKKEAEWISDGAVPAGGFDRVVFNFPHTGQQRVHLNRALLAGFFASARACLADESTGEVHVTLKLRPPYSQWGADDLAAAAGLRLIGDTRFDPGQFPGYRHRTTLADAKEAVDSWADVKHMRTLCFAVAEPRPTAEAMGHAAGGGAVADRTTAGTKKMQQLRGLSALESAMAAHAAGSRGTSTGSRGGLGFVRDTKGSGISKKLQRKQKLKATRGSSA